MRVPGLDLPDAVLADCDLALGVHRDGPVLYARGDFIDDHEASDGGEWRSGRLPERQRSLLRACSFGPREPAVR